MIQKYNYQGDLNVGFAATVTPRYAIYPPEFQKKDFFQAENVETFISRTRLPGIFTAGNSECLLVPDALTSREVSKLEESGIVFETVQARNNALGNLILANDSGAVISPKLESVKKDIETALGLDATVAKIAGVPNVGAAAAANNHGALIHREASEEEAETVKEALDVQRVDIGSINLGSPYIGSGLVCDDKDVLVGENTSGPEIGRIDRTLQ